MNTSAGSTTSVRSTSRTRRASRTAGSPGFPISTRRTRPSADISRLGRCGSSIRPASTASASMQRAIYHGTEVALPGGPDPDDRRPMPWAVGDEDVRQLVRDVASLRQAIPSLRRGTFDEIQSERGVVVYDRRGGPDAAVIAINGDQQRSIDVPLAKLGLNGGVLHRTVGPGTSGAVDGGTLRMTLAPRAAGIFLVGAAPDAFGLPLWSLLLLAVAVLVVAAAITLARRRLPRPA